MPAVKTAAPKRGRGQAKKTTDTPTVAATPTTGNGRRKPRAARGSRPLKPFKLYLQDGDSLSFVGNGSGNNGPDAIKRAMAAGTIEAGVPVVPISPRNLTPYAGKAIERKVTFVVESVGPKRRKRAARSSASNGGTTEAPAATETAPAPETPSTPGNPFATE